MKCKVEGCDRKAAYKSEAVCQKHYFRRMRYGTYNLTRSRKYRIQNPAGYQKVYEPDHALANSDGYVYEHRKVYFDQVDRCAGSCALCGRPEDWSTCHIDHIDKDVTNNKKENLRVACRNCNIGRTVVPGVNRKGAIAITVDGKTMTAHEWAKMPGVKCVAATIRNRVAAGWSHKDAVYGEKLTHNGRVPEKKPAPPKHTRKNAVRMTIDGETKTAAEWLRDSRCKVSERALVNRVKAGWDHREALLSPPKTGPNKKQREAE